MIQKAQKARLARIINFLRPSRRFVFRIMSPGQGISNTKSRMAYFQLWISNESSTSMVKCCFTENWGAGLKKIKIQLAYEEIDKRRVVSTVAIEGHGWPEHSSDSNLPAGIPYLKEQVFVWTRWHSILPFSLVPSLGTVLPGDSWKRQTKNDRDQNKRQPPRMRNSEWPNFHPKASQSADSL